ncbi:MAG: hypothetical protein M1812_002076 [Candelaria pacifica]|nr:MAG: hypothetical protein M1812_002076 [Candelaria pacifica]
MDFALEELSGRLQNKNRDYWIHINMPMNEIDKYPAKQHAKTVAALLDVSQGLIYLPGQATHILEDSDQTRPFRQRRYFYYLSGVNEPDCALTYDIESEFLTLYLPPTDPETFIWNGKALTIDAAKATYDVDDVRRSGPISNSGSLIWRDISAWINNNQGQCTVYCLHKHQEPPQCEYADTSLLQSAMDKARVRKDAHEIGLIRKANNITAAAHRDVLRKLSKFRNETEIQAAFLDACVARDAKHQAYDIIAAAGSNNSILHYVDNDQTLLGKQLVLLDAGCEWNCYASDVTRTFPLSGSWPSFEAKAIYDLVDLMQSACIERLEPGVHYLELYYLAQRIAIRELLQLGILHQGTLEEIFQARTVLAFFPHGLGHHLGLEVHDVSGVSITSRNEDDKDKSNLAPCTVDSPSLEEGMVVTVEPGIYFNSYALNQIYLPSPVHSKYINQDVLKRYMAVGGVRIEDDILITHDGYENLTTAPKGDEMLRIIKGTDSEASNDDEAKREANDSPEVASSEQVNQNDNLDRAINLVIMLGIDLDLVSPVELDFPKLSNHIYQQLLDQTIKSETLTPDHDQDQTRQLLSILGIDCEVFSPANLDFYSLVDEVLRQISRQCIASSKSSPSNKIDNTNQQNERDREDMSEPLTSESACSKISTNRQQEDESMTIEKCDSQNEAAQNTNEVPIPNPSPSNTVKLDCLTSDCFNILKI